MQNPGQFSVQNNKNLLFRVAEPPQAAFKDFEVVTALTEKFEFDFTVKDREIGLSLELEDGHLINMERWLMKNGSMEFKFNFHYPAASAAAANAILGQTFANNFERAKAIVSAYGFTVDTGAQNNG